MLTFGEAARLIDGRLDEVALAERPIARLMPLRSAAPADLTFITEARYQGELQGCRAAAVIIAPKLLARVTLPEGMRTVLCDDPMWAVAVLQTQLAPVPQVAQGLSPHAIVDAEASVDASAALAPGAIVARGAKVGPHCQLGAHSYVGESAELGAGCIVHPGAKILWGSKLGERVIVQPGAIIGSDGFGYAQRTGSPERIKVPQTGHVVLEDDVEIGANTTIDRATFGVTRIGARSKIDNLVQIAHNVTLGCDSVVVSQSGIAGSTSVGERVVIGAQVGVVGHIKICSDTFLAARTGVAGDIDAPGIYAGAPSMPHGQWLRAMALVRRLPELVRRIPKAAPPPDAGASTHKPAGNHESHA